MRLTDLIRRLQEQINALIATRNAKTAALNELRAADGYDVTAEAALITERSTIDAEMAPMRTRLESLEAELREEEAVQRSLETITVLPPVRPEGDAAAERVVAPTSTVRVKEERTYHAGVDQRRTPGTTFLSDVAASFVGNHDAQMRLNSHMAEERVERGDVLNRASGTGAFTGYVVPQYLVDMNVAAVTPARPFADICAKHVLPETGMTVNLSRITTGTSVDDQSAENAPVSETDIDDTLIPAAVRTAAGAQTVSRQAVQRGLLVEDVTVADLIKRYHTNLDSKLLNAATVGLTNVAGTVAYTDASPTGAELYPKLLAGMSAAEGVFLNAAQVDYLVMHPRRWRWLSAQMTTSWPLISSGRVPAQAGGFTTGVGYDKGVRGYLPDGTAVVTDANVATNLGAGTNEDEVYAVASSECHLWEDPAAPVFIRAEQPAAKNLSIQLVVYGYYAFMLNRYGASHQKIAGTGLTTPVFA